MIREYCKKFFYYFNNNKKAFFKYSALSFVVAILELFGVALTYPFVLKLLSNKPVDIWHSPIFIGLCIVFLFLLKNAFMIFYSYLQAKFTKEVEKEANLKFINYFLGSTYQKTSKISLSKKMHILGYLPANAINNYLVRILNLTVNLLVFILISGFLFIKFFNCHIFIYYCFKIFN